MALMCYTQQLIGLLMVGAADNICDTAKVCLREMAGQAKGVHDLVLDGLKPVAKTTFNFPLYNQAASNNTPVNNGS